MSTERIRFAGILAAAAALCFATTHPRVFAAGNDASRFAQIEALVDHGSPTIERSRFGRTVDRVEVDGRVYSNKPPFLSIVGAAFYLPLEVATGWRLGDPKSAGEAVRWLTFLLVGLPAALGVALFDRALAGRDGVERGLLTAGLALGTLVISFSGTLNHHVPAATLLLAAALAANRGSALASGGWCGFAAAVDLLPGLGCAGFFAWAASGPGADRSRRLARFAFGLVPGLAMLLLSNIAITGSWRTPKLLPGAVDLSARAGESVAGVVLPESWSYPVELLGGPHGLFFVSPILLFGAFGIVRAARSGDPGARHFFRALAAAIVCQFVGHALLAGSYGGWSYGYRYLIPIQPLLLLAAPFALGLPRRRVAFGALLAPSILFAPLGAYHPWPPAYEQAASGDPVATQVTNPVGGNAAAFAARHAPDSALTRWLGERFVNRDPELRRRYFALFFASRGDREGMAAFVR